ncbi:MAG: nucleotidyl transferase AbiEii/AbiGii toxin family protein [Bdellovibrionales bacterium]|nr:nucleotidyl transferase AbiEii/AbiGii toxin family protein [Bdellovibrionales bacterium]
MLPKALFRALTHLFAQGLQGCTLVGGAALSGFYAGHRRSDDLNLFAASAPARKAATLAAKSLRDLGAELRIQADTAQYFDAEATLERHRFKVTVVLDSHLHHVAKPLSLSGNVSVVDLNTLFKMKAATLVSRCTEKDLYDLLWLFGHFAEIGFADLVRLGHEIDGGVSAEAMLSSVAGTPLRKEACDFSLDRKIPADEIHAQLFAFRKLLLKGLSDYLEGEPAPPLAALVKALGRFRRR